MNGKTTIQRLLEKLMGDYTINIDNLTLYLRYSDHTHYVTPLFRILEGKHVCFSELEVRQTITPTMKEIAIMSEIQCKVPKRIIPAFEHVTVRQPKDYKTSSFKNQTTFIISDCHKIKDPSQMKIIKFRSRFVRNPNPLNQYEYKVDYSIGSKIRTLGQAFFWLLTK